jgi:hypothetical protein
MELVYDWKSFQSLFYVKKGLPTTDTPGSIYLVADGRVVISAFSENEDLSDWIGATYDEMLAEFAHRELVLFSREKVDQWMSEAVSLPHYYDQMRYLRAEAKPDLITRTKFRAQDVISQGHFLLDALQTWWNKILPTTYGIYLSLDGLPGSSLLIIVQRGRLSSFHVPELTTMIPERRKEPGSIVRFLSERHSVPVQGLFLTTEEWVEWSKISNPWPKIGSALKSNRNKLVPFKWGMASLIMVRAYFGF